MRISRHSFLKLTAAGAAGAMVPSTIDGAQPAAPAPAKPKKQQHAAIKGTTDAVATFIATASLRRMPADAIEQAKRCLVDGFGVILAGSTLHGSAIVRDYVRRPGDRKEATILGASSFMAPVRPRRSSTVRAATRWISTTRSCRRRRIAPTGC
jgi:hypothetical protein